MYKLKLIFFLKWIFMGSKQRKITSDFFFKISKKKSLDSFNTKSIFLKAETNIPLD